jgi:hypothetical protein
VKCVYNEMKFAKMHAYCVLCTYNMDHGVTHATTNLLKHVERHHKNEHKIIMHDQATERQCKLAGTDSISTCITCQLDN